MSNVFGFVFGLFAIFSFAFILWRELKEDYLNETIFKFTLALFFGVGLGSWLAGIWLPDFVFWGSFAGGLVAGFYLTKKLGLRFFEIIDGLTFAALVFMLVLYLGQMVKILPHVSYYIAAKTFLVLLLLGLYGYFLKSYRRLGWYPSGKVGFAGLATLALFFLGRTLIFGTKQYFEPEVIFSSSALHFSTELVNVIISLSLFALLWNILYGRSGR